MVDTDTSRFTPPKSDGTILVFQFFILPPLQKGDICTGGKASLTMELFYVPYGHHWVDGQLHVCPRIVSKGEEDCPMCQGGYDFLKESKARKASKEKMRAIGLQWLPQVANLVNIYFPAAQANPEELHGQVKYFMAPQTCFGHWRDCIDRLDAGDAEKPQAYGAFFDEFAAFLYELRIGKRGEWNEYSTSGFIAVDADGKRATRPVTTKRSGEPDMKAIQGILDQRHDLWLKQGTTDAARLERLVAELRHVESPR